MAPIKVVVVGGGRIGTIHLHNLQRNPRAQVTFTIDVDEARAQAMAAQAGCQAATNLSDVLKNHPDQVDAVIICSPTAHHFSQVKECIEHGKAILCEKPLSMDVAEIEEAYALATEKNVPLLCGYQRRHDRSFSALVHMIRNNDIGSCHVIKSTSRDNPVPQIAFLKISGGIMHDCASHDIDVIRWVSGEDPVEVYCVANAFNPEIAALDDFDTVLATLKLPSGALGTIDLARHAPYGYDQRIEVLGETGMLQAENLKPTTVVRSTALGETKDPNCYSFPQRYEITYALELDHFIDMIQKGVPPIVTGDDCRKTAIIADAATESLKTGKPVKIDYSKRFQGH